MIWPFYGGTSCPLDLIHRVRYRHRNTWQNRRHRRYRGGVMSTKPKTRTGITIQIVRDSEVVWASTFS